MNFTCHTTKFHNCHHANLDDDSGEDEATDSVDEAGHHHVHPLYMISQGDPNQSQLSSLVRHGLGASSHVYPIKSAQHQSRMIDMQDQDYLAARAQNMSTHCNNHSNTSSLARDMRYSRSMGNNLDSVHMNGIMASRNIAALDVLPRSVADTSVVFDEPHSRQNQIPQCINMTSLQQPKRIVLPRDGSQVPSSSLCLNSLRSRFAGNDSTTTGSSASGSRPPSPIIEVIPVAEYETKYGSLQHQNQHSPIYSPQYVPSSQQALQPVYNNR